MTSRAQILGVHFGKVRDSAKLSNGTRVIRTSDRISAFDMMMPFYVSGKGECLQNISLNAFQETADILPNHIIGRLDSRTILATQVDIIPIEFIMRRFVTGSLWRLFRKGGAAAVNALYGLDIARFAESGKEVTEHFRLLRPIFTPTHKSQEGHDEPLHLATFESLLENFLKTRKIASISANALKELLIQKLEELFLRGEEIADKRGLILVDTKYELGLTADGKLMLADEVHTPDSSRYWLELPKQGTVKQLSKEFLREELMGADVIENDDLTAGGLDKLHAMAGDLAARISDRYSELERVFMGQSQQEKQGTLKITWPVPESEFEDAIAPATKIRRLFIAGNGGRDFTIMNRFSTLPGLRNVWNWPGHRAWKSRQVPVSNVSSESFEAAIVHVQNQHHNQTETEGGIDLVIAGPEMPIAEGIKDFCRQRNIACLAPGPKGASLEASKLICKKALVEAGIPTAEYQTVTLTELLQMPQAPRLPCVLKFDGLASGKGVFMIASQDDWREACVEITLQSKVWMSATNSLKCASASAQAREPIFLVENCLTGDEYSVFALCNGAHFRLLPLARDYKRRNDGQRGPNTGGMGAVAPIQVSENLLAQFKDAFQRILNEQIKQNEPYTGFLFGGFMVSSDGQATVLEFNSRLGDPETQVILPGLADDFLLECYRTASGLPFFWPENSGTFFDHDGLSRVFVVGASPEYPNATSPYRKLRRKDREDTLPESQQCLLVPSAVEADGRTKGGRAFGILSKGKSIADARTAAYREMETYLLDDIEPHFRKDIAAEWPE